MHNHIWALTAAPTHTKKQKYTPNQPCAHKIINSRFLPPQVIQKKSRSLRRTEAVALFISGEN
jgi:hypothetical protein